MRVFTHFMWAAQHVQFDKKKREQQLKESQKETANVDKKKANFVTEPTMEEVEVQKTKLRKILKKDQEKDQKTESTPEEMEELDEIPEEEKMYTCTRLSGISILQIIQKQPKELNGGIVINYGVNPEMCDVANRVIISTEDIMTMDLDSALEDANKAYEAAGGK